MENDVFRPGGLTLTKKYADLLSLNEGSAVLDIGCGAGTTLAFLKKEYGCRVAGADLSPRAAALAAQKVPDADIRTENASALSFADAGFDAALMECTLTLFEDPCGALKEAFRVLRPGGRLLILTLTKEAEEAFREGAADPEKLISVLEAAGFSEVSYLDEKHSLTQFFCDVVFEYGSPEEYARAAESALGGAVFCGGPRTKGLSYGAFTALKKG